jgi:purine-binding chemotaxis protein CheW
MDLAKIRKKHRQTPSGDSIIHFQPDIRTAAPAVPSLETAIVASVSSEGDIICSTVPGKFSQVPTAVLSSERIIVYRDPVEIILAGRSAAGCDEKLPDDDEEISTTVSDNCLEYLCFRVSDEIYGINIMEIKEIIRPRKVTEIPRAPQFVSGVISLRGTIIPIIDMLSRLGLHRENVTGKERVVVIKYDRSFCGLLVDEVIKVLRVNKENVEPAPSVLDGIDRDFVSGIGRSEGLLIIILNLENIADINLY